MKLKELLNELEKIAPLSLSDAFVSTGAHDNSGIIVHNHDQVEKVLFALDLSDGAVKKAVKVGADTIVTHHPAIYYPISSLSIDNENSALLSAIKNGLNVISMHLNLDITSGGIDDSLSSALGCEDCKVIFEIVDGKGYGKEGSIEQTTFGEFCASAVKELSAKNYLTYGKADKKVKKVASFCGAGSKEAVSYDGKADVIVTSDMPHHCIKTLVEKGKCVLLLTHYATEVYGFKKFEQAIKEVVKTCFYDDERFY